MNDHTEEPSNGPVLTQEQLAKRWDITVRSLQNYRKSGKGPRYMLMGFSPRYLLSEIEAYELSQQKEPGTKARDCKMTEGASAKGVAARKAKNRVKK